MDVELDRQEWIHRAAKLVPMLRERAAETEARRCIPQDIVDALHASEVLRAVQPKRFGGLGYDFHLAFDIAAELGRGCGSTAWCYGVWSSHTWLAGMFPEQAQEAYWADSPDTLSSTSFNPARGKVRAVPGGYQVTGQWDFSSGCDAASWVLLVGNGPDGQLMLMLPRSDYTIEDTWFVSGLRGTGSKDIHVADAFVPEHRTVLIQDMREARTPGREVHDRADYRIPLRSVLSFTLASPVLGMAQGALDVFEAQMRGAVSARDGKKRAESTNIQMRLSESAAEVYTARLIMHHDTREIFARARCGDMPALGDRVRYRRDQAYMAKLCVRSVNRLFEISGGQSIHDASAIQRFHRDIHAATHHMSLTWDPVAEQYGKFRLGIEEGLADV
ncbi:acyl-CoA dehydrogenase family protein [Candidatus Entotheonella palauensis]|nr:acyl-CoA dehydrogenase family protein [Candidatus Entotheonella palauensis]